MLLSGGTALNDYNAGLNSAAYLNSPTYDPMAAQAAFIAANGPAWSPPPAMPAFDLGVSYQAPSYQPAYTVPVQSYSAPIPTLPVSTGGGEPPINVNYSPTQVSQATQNLAPMQFPGMSFNPQAPAEMINIGGRNYGADQVIAANPQITFAPGGTPQMDTVSDGAYGYQATRIPEQPTADGQAYQLGGEAETLPPDLMGSPNPYMQPMPKAPVYYQNPMYQAAMQVPQQAIQSLPTLDQYYTPQPEPQANSLGGALKRAVWAMNGPARQRAAAYADARARHKEDANRQAMLMQVSLPAQIGLNREGLQQMGADYRSESQHRYQGALSLLNFNLDRIRDRMLAAKDALDLASNAFLQPSVINGQINRQKVQMLRQAGSNLGWSEEDIAGLLNQQDQTAAQHYKQEALKTDMQAFQLNKAQQMLTHEINLLRSQATENNAQAGLAQSQAGFVDTQAQANRFNLKQRAKIAKYERWGMIADAMNKVDEMLVNRGSRQSRIDNAKLANQKLQADIYRQQMEAANVPVESAAKMASAMASMGQSTDKTIKAAGANMADSVFSLLGITEKQVMTKDASGRDVLTTVPVHAPETISNFRQNMPPPPSYRQPVQPQQLPPSYFSGAPLAGEPNQFNNMGGGQPDPGAR